VTTYMQSALYAIARPSVTRVDQSEMVEVRIMQLSPRIAQSLYFCDISLIQTFWWVPHERDGSIRHGWGWERKLFSSFMRRYLKNGTRYDQSYY